MKEIYLDNCATTKPRKEVVAEMIDVLEEDYGNPSSLHRKGFLIEKRINKARETIANFLGVSKEEIYFTSGGTESNNLAIQSIVDSSKDRAGHIITTEIEHSSVTNIMRYYEELGYDITYLKVDKNGIISLDELRESLREDTVLVSIIYVNNEIGCIQPMDEISSILRETRSKAKLHLDAIQAVGKVPLSIRRWDIDTLSLSGHKLYGPKGVGVLYVKKGLKLSPLVYGGNQERGLRSGTENVPGIVAMGKAFEILTDRFEDEYSHALELKEYLIENISKKIDGIRINSPLGIDSSPYIVNISFDNIRSEILLHYLEDKNIYVSTGSACSKGTEKSRTLEGIGLDDREIDGAIRICFSYRISKEDLDVFIDETKKAVEEIREITMR